MYLPEVHLDLRDESGNACSFPFSCFSFFSLKKKSSYFYFSGDCLSMS